jgi:hypothetical protein
MHNFLVHDGFVFLPKVESVTIDFLKLIIKGEKKVSVASRVAESFYETSKAHSHSFLTYQI